MVLLLKYFKMYAQVIFVVFLAPEILELSAWKKFLWIKVFNDRLSIVVVGEAHCIAEWSVVSCVFISIIMVV